MYNGCCLLRVKLVFHSARSKYTSAWLSLRHGTQKTGGFILRGQLHTQLCTRVMNGDFNALIKISSKNGKEEDAADD